MDEEQAYFQKVLDAYRYYAKHARILVQQKTEQWNRLDIAYRQLIPEYDGKLERLRGCSEANAQFIGYLVPSTKQDLAQLSTQPETEMEKVRSVLRQMVRDWSEEGASERRNSYDRIISTLQELFPRDRSSVRVLVPGAGLGRLAYDIAKHGFSCQGNELSFYMLLASNYMLNRCARQHEFTIFPWCHSFANHQSVDAQLRPVLIPDTLPGELPDDVHFSMAAGEFLEVYNSDSEYCQWDSVVTCFSSIPHTISSSTCKLFTDYSNLAHTGLTTGRYCIISRVLQVRIQLNCL
jgi:carnosine N-methyltransferase